MLDVVVVYPLAVGTANLATASELCDYSNTNGSPSANSAEVTIIVPVTESVFAEHE